MIRQSLVCAVLLLVSATASAQTHVTCVGDSITLGTGTTDPMTQSYPSILGGLLGPSYAIGNFGGGGSTFATYPVSPKYAASLAWADVGGEVIIVWGTNEVAASDGWPAARKAQLVADCSARVDRYRLHGARVWLGNAITSVRQVSILDINEGIAECARTKGVTAIDIYGATRGHPEYMFSDGIHPNAAGASKIALRIYDVMSTDAGLTTDASVDSWADAAVVSNDDVGKVCVNDGGSTIIDSPSSCRMSAESDGILWLFSVAMMLVISRRWRKVGGVK